MRMVIVYELGVSDPIKEVKNHPILSNYKNFEQML